MTGRKKDFMYVRIAADLRTRIGSNDFPGGRLPPERILARHYSTNRLTLRKALSLLEDEDLLFRDSTRGTFVGSRRSQTNDQSSQN